jgi:hypothetical protein
MKSHLHLLSAALFSAQFFACYACVPLRSGDSVKVSTSRKDPVCLLVEIAPGENTTQVVAQQREDLEIDVTNSEDLISVDSFEFGPETATILGAGNYRILIRPVDLKISSLSFLMSRRAVSSQQALNWRKAEELATKSKRTGAAADAVDSLEVWKQVGDQSAISRTYLKQGDAAANSGEIASAKVAYEQSLDLCRALSDLRCAAEAANNAGLSAQQSGVSMQHRTAWPRLRRIGISFAR